MSRAADREALLAQWIAGELNADDPRVERLLSEAGSNRARLEALRKLARDLDAAGELQAQVLREDREGMQAPGEQEVRGRIERLAREEPHRGEGRPVGPGRAWNRRWFLVAAVLLMMPLAMQIGRWLAPPPDAPFEYGPRLGVGGGGVRIEAPLDPAEGLRWSVPDPRPTDVFEVSILALREDGSAELWRREAVEGSTHWLPAEGLENLPEHYRIEVLRLLPDGTPMLPAAALEGAPTPENSG